MLTVKLGARVHSFFRGPKAESRVLGLWSLAGKAKPLGWSSCGPHRHFSAWDTGDTAQYQQRALSCEAPGTSIGIKAHQAQDTPSLRLLSPSLQRWEECGRNRMVILARIPGLTLPQSTLTRTFHEAPFSLDALLRLATLLLPLVPPSKSIRKSLGSAGLCQRRGQHTKSAVRAARKEDGPASYRR